MKIVNKHVLISLIISLMLSMTAEAVDNALLDVDDLSCSRDKSRLARKIVYSELFKYLPNPTNNITDAISALPASCPLHPMHDTFLDQEKNKQSDSNRDWKCKYCGKAFISEYYIDRHMALKHPDKQQNSSSMCLGDVCPILGCNIKPKSLGEVVKRGLSIHDWSKYSMETTELCTVPTIEKYKHKCRIIMRSCFSGLVDLKNRKLDLLFENTICKGLRCEHGIIKGQSFVEQSPSYDVPVAGWLLQIVLTVIVLICILGYAIFSDCSWRTFFPNITSKNILLGTQRNLKRSVDHKSWLKYTNDLIKKIYNSKHV